MQEKAFADPKVEFYWDTVVVGIEGEGVVKSLRLRDVKSGKETSLEVDGIFVSIGFSPNTAYLKDILPLDTTGNVITNQKMETEIPGVLAAGDIRHNSIRQIASAIGDGATAAIYAERFLAE
jgi:thioredoxin reductase (NADPH)